MAYATNRYEVVTFLERGWWVIDLPDIGQRTRAPTLATVEPTARRLIAQSIGRSVGSFELDIETLRVTRDSIVRARWRSLSAVGEIGLERDAARVQSSRF